MKNRRPSKERIAERAFQIYVENGCKPGHDVDNWLQAEYELMQLPVQEIAKLPPVKPSKGRALCKSIVGVIHAAIF